MDASQALQRWAGRGFLVLVATFGMLGYYYANVRFLPLMAGFAILAAVCYAPRAASPATRALRESGRHRAI
jgi:hypothetical protein